MVREWSTSCGVGSQFRGQYVGRYPETRLATKLTPDPLRGRESRESLHANPTHKRGRFAPLCARTRAARCPWRLGGLFRRFEKADQLACNFLGIVMPVLGQHLRRAPAEGP